MTRRPTPMRTQPNRSAAGPRPIYMPTQPQRCAGGETGLGDACLACGARPEHLCQAPVAARPKVSRRAKA